MGFSQTAGVFRSQTVTLGLQLPTPFHRVLQVEQTNIALKPRALFLWFPSLVISLHTFQEAVTALRMLNILHSHINSLGKNLALNLWVYTKASNTLADVVSFNFAMVM